MLFETHLEPDQLLSLLHETEAAAGRRRTTRWEPRSIDLDLLLYADRIVIEAELRIPHAWMAFRPFVLAPATEIASTMMHPEIHWTVGQLARHAARTPKIVALAPCPKVAFDAVISGLSDVPALRSLRFHPFDTAEFGSFNAERAIEFMSDRAAWLIEQLRPCPANATILVGGWWDQPMIGADDGPIGRQQELRRALVQIERQLNPPVPHVSVVLTEHQTAHDCANAVTVYNYLRRPGRGPFLVESDRDVSQIVQDVRAIVAGFQSLANGDPASS